MPAARAIALLGLAACAGAPADPLPATPHVRAHPKLELLPRPAVQAWNGLAAADPLPWPLEQPPSLLPHDAEAARCDAVAVHASLRATADAADADAYARAWCAAERQDPDDRLAVLHRLAHHARGHLARAALADEADLLADRFATSDALRWLRAHDASPALYDRLVATLVALDRPRDALAAAQLAWVAGTATDPAACHRAIELAVLRGEDPAAHADPKACRDVVDDARCQIAMAPGSRETNDELCRGYIARHPDERADIELELAVRRWPSSAGDWVEWLDVAKAAVLAVELPNAEALALAALTNATITWGCLPAPRQRLTARGRELLASPDHDPAFNERLWELIARAAAPCP